MNAIKIKTIDFEDFIGKKSNFIGENLILEQKDKYWYWLMDENKIKNYVISFRVYSEFHRFIYEKKQQT